MASKDPHLKTVYANELLLNRLFAGLKNYKNNFYGFGIYE